MSKFIAVAYKLYTSNSTTPQEVTSEDQPFAFITGIGMALDSFEEKVADLPTGKAFDFTIPCEEAYGMPAQERIVTLPRGIFEIDGKFDDENIKPGAFVPMNNADGQRLLGKVTDITDTNVLMDFNHPFAGSDLHFTGHIVESREATEKEKQQAMKIMRGEGGCGGCGGGCKGGSCGDGCGDGCDSGCGDGCNCNG
ncbi:MAG: FKBP-type peptidyl-prolyl cis-trans isomerase [Bacteroidaceae bacterium]|nr:FKBP-type peptidyl-prolyl cis-trans isomerase [Bacteroidaceae bacterium]